MRDDIKPEALGEFLKEFSKRNKSRPTWLQILGEDGAQSEESGLPLMGVTLEARGGKTSTVQIMLGGYDPVESRHLTHVIDDVDQVKRKVASDGRDEAIEFIDKNGDASLLIFTHRARMAAHAS